MLILRKSQTSAPGLNSQHPEEFAADKDSGHNLEITALSHRNLIHAPRKDAREGRVIAADLLPYRPRQFTVISVHAHPMVAAGDLHLCEFSWVPDGQAAQPDRIQQLKDSCVRADSQRQ